MNLDPTPPPHPLEVVLTNPQSECSHLLMLKMLSGSIFGSEQPVRLKLLADYEDFLQVESFKNELEKCAFDCLDEIEIIQEFQSVFNTADIICFVTQFINPNRWQLSDNHPPTVEAIEQMSMFARILSDAYADGKRISKPVVVADGLNTLHIIQKDCVNVQPGYIYCPNPLTDIAKSVLGEFLKVTCAKLNDMLVWAADDETFHISVQKPLILNDEFEVTKCDWDLVAPEFNKIMNMDNTQFNDSWIKKNLVEKTKGLSSRNPYGCVSRAHSLAAALKDVWSSFARSQPNNKSQRIYSSMGVISDGHPSYGAHKGIPYVLPLIIEEGKWSINKKLANNTYVMSEMKIINNAAKIHSNDLKCWRRQLQQLTGCNLDGCEARGEE